MNHTSSTLKAAIQHHKDGDIDASILCLKSALEGGDRHELVLGMLASHYAEIGMTIKAVPLYEEIIQANPLNHLARFQLGHIYYSQGEYGRALETWEETLAVEEEFVTKFYAAKAYIALDKPLDAKKLLEQSITSAPSSHPIRAEAEQTLRLMNLGN